MIIRDFIESDRETYIAFSKDFYAGGAVLHPVDTQNFHNTFAECVKGSPYTRGVMLVEGEEPVGYALFSFTWSNEVGAMQVLFEELYLAPGHRGAGYGSQVFAWMRREYPDAGRYRLEVAQENVRARRLYERLGFSELGYVQMVSDR